MRRQGLHAMSQRQRAGQLQEQAPAAAAISAGLQPPTHWQLPRGVLLHLEQAPCNPARAVESAFVLNFRIHAAQVEAEDFLDRKG